MDNFELHEKATRLADTHSSYMLAKLLLIEQKERVELAELADEMRGEISRKDRLLGSSVRDEFKSATSPVGSVQNEIAKLERERDALAAHVERLCAHIMNAEELHPAKWAVQGHKLIHNSPTTSLARRDKIQQARALEALSSASGSASAISRKSIDNIAADLRQQASQQASQLENN